jgi:uncharacterized repeat protein (TIGR03803 family)
MKILRIVCLLGGFLSLDLSMPAQTYTTLYTFRGAAGTAGASPRAPLVQATNGTFYGTTSSGGSAKEDGTVFKITPGGTLTTVHRFHGKDGANPVAPLAQATDGNLYGTASAGGANGKGTVFKISATGNLTNLYSFCSQSGCTDGSAPYAGLVQATNGDFYGTTENGGAFNDGTIFKITHDGTLTTLYSFDGTDGSGPAGLIQATDGNFYGTTVYGANGGGTVFEITPGGTLTTLYSFCSQPNCTDGAGSTGLIQATDGNFYGTTVGGGAHDGGTAFSVTPSGALTKLYDFCSRGGSVCADGYFPNAALLQATDGNFYGTTQFGGANGRGTVFEITPSGTLTTLHSFEIGYVGDGAFPEAALIQATDGNFYGTTTRCPCYPHQMPMSFGTVFSLSVGLHPFVETQPTSGSVGAAVKILGTDLAGATSVKFNGTGAKFAVASSSEITTEVPAGATTGKIEVTTPGGTLTSNVNFQVTP